MSPTLDGPRLLRSSNASQSLRPEEDTAYLIANMLTKPIAMTRHLLFGTVVFAALAAALLGQLARESVQQRAVVAMQQTTTMPSPGFAGAFGRGPAVRNLIF